jgi:hypothetical protein
VAHTHASSNTNYQGTITEGNAQYSSPPCIT